MTLLFVIILLAALGLIFDKEVFPGFIFVYAVIITSLGISVGLISWNLVSLSFDLRRFKTAGRRASAYGTLGSSLSGFLLPFLITVFAESLFLTLLIGL